MKIVKFKKMTKGRYKLELDSNEEFIIYEDIIFKYDLLLKKEISITKLESILNDNKYYEAYNLALSYIEYKLRSKKEIHSYLERKDFPNDIILKVIKDIEALGYINDRLYTKAFISDKINFTNHGPYKIKGELLSNGIDESIIDEELDNIDENIYKEKITKLIEKKKKTNDKPLSIFKSKIIEYLYNLGYSKELINEVLYENKESLENDKIDKKLELEKDKLYKKYSTKYEGSKLDYQVKMALRRKGYSTDEINRVIDSSYEENYY